MRFDEGRVIALIWIWLLMLVMAPVFISCDGKDAKVPKDPSAVYYWVGASTSSYEDEGNGLQRIHFDTTSNDTARIYSYKICRSLKIFADEAKVTLMDSDFDIDVRNEKIYKEVAIPLSGGEIHCELDKTEGDSSLSHFRIHISPDSNHATAILEYIVIPWDTLASTGVRSDIQDFIYLKGVESDSTILELIRKRVYKLGMWDQYYEKKSTPEFGSMSRRIFRAVVLRYRTELRKVDGPKGHST